MKIDRYLPWLVWTLFLALYFATAAPSIVELFDDSLEFQLVGPTFGIAHPTGYPLYILLGGLWSRVLFPVGNWAWRMNLFSALAAASTVTLVFQLARRLVTRADGQPNTPAGLAAALALGVSPVWWAQATIAEVYTLHGLFVAAILWVALGINEFKDRIDYRITLLCALIGLSLTHHRTTLLLLPPLAVYLLSSIPSLWRPRPVWLRWLLALLTPLLLYLWLPLRAAQGIADLNSSYRNTWPGFWAHVLALGYTRTFLIETGLTGPVADMNWVALFRQQVGLLGLGLGALGLIGGLGRLGQSAKAWICIGLILITNILFATNYNVSDVEVFLLPAFLCLALLIGGGVGVLERWLSFQPWLANVVQALIVLLLIFGGRNSIINRSNAWVTHDYATAMAKVNFPSHSQVIGLEGEITALKYMQQAERLGLGVTGIVADDPEARRQAIATAIAGGYPTFVTRELPGIADQYSFSGEGPLVRVWPRGEAQVGEPQYAVDISLADDTLQLEGYDHTWLAEAGGPSLQIVFYWRLTAPITQTFKLSLRLQQPDGAPLRWPDGSEVTQDHFPLRQVANTPDWVVDERVRDVHTLRTPDGSDLQAARLQVIIYDAATVLEAGAWSIDLPGP